MKEFINITNEELKELVASKILDSIEELDLSGNKNLTDISPLKNLQNLKKLVLVDCTWVRDISPLKNLQNLREINIAFCTSITDISPLKNLQNLTKLNLNSSRNIKLEELNYFINILNIEIIGLTKKNMKKFKRSNNANKISF